VPTPMRETFVFTHRFRQNIRVLMRSV